MALESKTIAVSNVHVKPLQVLGGAVYWIPFMEIWDCSKVTQGGRWGAANDKITIIFSRSNVLIVSKPLATKEFVNFLQTEGDNPFYALRLECILVESMGNCPSNHGCISGVFVW